MAGFRAGLAAPFVIDPGQAEQIIGRAASLGLIGAGGPVLTSLWSPGRSGSGCVVVQLSLTNSGLLPVRWWRPCR